MCCVSGGAFLGSNIERARCEFICRLCGTVGHSADWAEFVHTGEREENKTNKLFVLQSFTNRAFLVGDIRSMIFASASTWIDIKYQREREKEEFCIYLYCSIASIHNIPLRSRCEFRPRLAIGLMTICAFQPLLWECSTHDNHSTSLTEEIDRESVEWLYTRAKSPRQ